MNNSFYGLSTDYDYIYKESKRIYNNPKLGVYAGGPYPTSLFSYNLLMQDPHNNNVLTAPLDGRDLLGCFKEGELMDQKVVDRILSTTYHNGKKNDLESLIIDCDVVLLGCNTNRIDDVFKKAKEYKIKHNQNTVLVNLAGGFCAGNVLCDTYNDELAFIGGYGPQELLRDPYPSFSLVVAHPDVMNALMLQKIFNDKFTSKNIKVLGSIHSIELQFIKSMKNILSILSGAIHYLHNDDSTLANFIQLAISQVKDQASTISAIIDDRRINSVPITVLGSYGVEKIESTIGRFRRLETVAQVTPIIADVYGSITPGNNGKNTRNFRAGECLGEYLRFKGHCPTAIDFVNFCQEKGLKIGELEGIKALQQWPMIRMQYKLRRADCTLPDLLWHAIYGIQEEKISAYNVLITTSSIIDYIYDEKQDEFNDMTLLDKSGNISDQFVSGVIANNSFKSKAH